MERANGHQAFPGKPKGIIINPAYHTLKNPLHQGNPLIEALPPRLSRMDAISQLQHYPLYDEEHRGWDDQDRCDMLENILLFREPLNMHLRLERDLAGLIRVGYIARNPLANTFYDAINNKAVSLRVNDLALSQAASSELSMIIIGDSGVGKSTALNMVLSLYPQLIIHNEYKGERVGIQQVVWLKIECPADGSTKALCNHFIKQLDKCLGTNYWRTKARNGRGSKEEMISEMAQLAADHCLGALVIDEVQDINDTSSGGQNMMLNLFVELINTMEVPVILVGTYAAKSLLQGKFRIARRGTGQGDIVWKRMRKDDEWDSFIEALWTYQYVRNDSPLTGELNTTLYEESLGITDFAVKLYKLAQRRAIDRGVERVTPDLIRSVAIDSFNLTRDVVLYLRGLSVDEPIGIDDIEMRPLEMEKGDDEDGREERNGSTKRLLSTQGTNSGQDDRDPPPITRNEIDRADDTGDHMDDDSPTVTTTGPPDMSDAPRTGKRKRTAKGGATLDTPHAREAGASRSKAGIGPPRRESAASMVMQQPIEATRITEGGVC